MKKITLILLLLTHLCFVKAQSRKAFVDATGAIAKDSTKATSYLVYKRISDSVWSATQYGMDNAQLSTGTYRDPNLQILHGRFFYYSHANFFKNPTAFERMLKNNDDTTNYVSIIGVYRNGKKNGLWTEYFANGSKKRIAYYANDKAEGVYEEYGGNDSIPVLKGVYKDGLRQGIWSTYSLHGNLIQQEFYLDNVVKNTSVVPIKIAPPTPPEKLDNYFKKSLKKTFKSNFTGMVAIAVTITKAGKIKDQKLQIYAGGVLQRADDLSNTISKTITDCPLTWSPAFDRQNNHLIDYDVIFYLNVDSGDVTFNYMQQINIIYYLMMH